MDLRDRYLNLLKESLTGTLYEDPSAMPWSDGKYNPDLRGIGADWPRTALTMIGSARMDNLRQVCEYAITEDIPGDFLEGGVWRGGACIYMAAILAAWGEETRRVFVADSFCGLPPPDPERYPADANSRFHTYPQLAVPRSEVEANFRHYELLDERVVFVEGWFRDSLPGPVERLAVLRIDADMYEGVTQALEVLYERVSVGGSIVIDDYGAVPTAKAATDDFRAARGITAPLIRIDPFGVWWRV